MSKYDEFWTLVNSAAPFRKYRRLGIKTNEEFRAYMAAAVAARPIEEPRYIGNVEYAPQTLIVSTLFREERIRGLKGNIYLWDLTTNQLRAKISGTSFRGLTMHNGVVHVADFNNAIYRLVNSQLVKWKEFAKCAYLHLIYSRDGRLVTTNSGNNCIVYIDDDGNEEVHCVGNKADSDTHHFNSIGWDSNGHEYHIYNKQNRVVNYTTGATIYDVLSHPHDIDFVDDNHFVVNSSKERQTKLINAQTRQLAHTIHTIPPRKSNPVNDWGFTRGIHIDGASNKIYLGSGPVHIHIYDTSSWDRLEYLELSNDPAESIFDILVI